MAEPIDFQKQMLRVEREIELKEATEKAITLGKEIALMLADSKPVTKCLIAHTLYKQYRREFPKVFEAFEKLGV